MALVETFYWTFGDGTDSTEEFPEHVYLHPGVYTVTFINYLDGASTESVTTVTVDAPTLIGVGDFCLRLAVEPSQGIEWSEISGDDWVSPIDVLSIIDDNDVPRMLIEDSSDNFVWEDGTFDRVKYQKPSMVDKYYEDSLRTVDLRWIASALGTNEYYLERLSGGDPEFTEPKQLIIDEDLATKGDVGSLATGEWDYGDNDTLGYDTVYVRLSDDTDPDTKDLGYIAAVYWTEISTETWYGEDTSDPSAEESKQELIELHWYTRPNDPNNKGKSEYDSLGYREDQEFSLDIYKDGNLVRPHAQVSELPENGDIVFSGVKLQGRRFQPVFKTATSEFKIVGRNLFKIVKPMACSSEERSTDRTKAEAALALPSFFIGRDRLTPLMNRVTGSVIPGTVTVTTGPDGLQSSAIVIPAAGLDLMNDAIAGAYTFMFWRSTTAPVVTVPALPALTQYSLTNNGWQLMYVVDTVLPANIILTQGIASTIRIFSGDISQYLQLYYNSMIYDEEPKPFEPGL